MKRKRRAALLLSGVMAFMMVAAILPADQVKAEEEEIVGVSMFRLYNPNSGEHFYTANGIEWDNLISVGWQAEGIGWYGVDIPVIPDKLADGTYSSDDSYTAEISDDLRMLTADTSWFYYDTTTWEKIVDYPRKEYHIPISEQCIVTSVGLTITSWPISEGIDYLRGFINGLPLSIVVKNGEIIEFGMMS